MEGVAQSGFLGDRDFQHLRHLLDDLREVVAAHHEPALAGVGQHLAAQVRGPLGSPEDILHIGAGRRRGRKREQRQVGVSQDGHEQVVKVVGDAPGQHPQAFQLLDFPNLGFQLGPFFFGPLALTDIADSLNSADDIPLTVI